MKLRICELLGIEFPLFAFSHRRDVVAAVSRAGAARHCGTAVGRRSVPIRRWSLVLANSGLGLVFLNLPLRLLPFLKLLLLKRVSLR
jgi:hypothetical protein